MPLTKSITCPLLGIKKTSKKLEVVDTYLRTINNTHDKPITNILNEKLKRVFFLTKTWNEAKLFS